MTPFSLDVNLLLFAADKSHSLHGESEKFLRAVLNEPDPCLLCWETLHGFIRISTNSRIFSNPLPETLAMENARMLAGHPKVTMLGASEDSFRILETLVAGFHLRGPIISDAVVASVLEANGVRRIYTHDRDFWKFPYLKPIDPLSK